MSHLLCLEPIVMVPATDCFVVKDHFIKGEDFSLGRDFRKKFLCKVEENIPEARLNIHHLREDSSDKSIMEELGHRVEISLAHLFALLKRQRNGEAGVLLVNGSPNIAYIRGGRGKLWAVRLFWGNARHAWFINSGSTDRPGGWRAGARVVSLN